MRHDWSNVLVLNSLGAPCIEIVDDSNNNLICEYCGVRGEGPKCVMCGAPMPVPSILPESGLLLLSNIKPDSFQSVMRMMVAMEG